MSPTLSMDTHQSLNDSVDSPVTFSSRSLTLRLSSYRRLAASSKASDFSASPNLSKDNHTSRNASDDSPVTATNRSRTLSTSSYRRLASSNDPSERSTSATLLSKIDQYLSACGDSPATLNSRSLNLKPSSYRCFARGNWCSCMAMSPSRPNCCTDRRSQASSSAHVDNAAAVCPSTWRARAKLRCRKASITTENPSCRSRLEETSPSARRATWRAQAAPHNWSCAPDGAVSSRSLGAAGRGSAVAQTDTTVLKSRTDQRSGATSAAWASSAADPVRTTARGACNS